ncbi:DsbA family protein [Alphaproteobacteria bacterium]|nr:DsbA family protein [Alphaproteobacteria bacterium]
MTLKAELYWSFRSPYCYLGTAQYREIAETYDLDIEVKVVYPIAIRNPKFFEKVNPLWIPYLIKDCLRIAKFRGMAFPLPSPDPIVQDLNTREIANDQPYITDITRLGIEAAKEDRGLAFLDEVSKLIWGGTKDWHMDDQLAPATRRAGLDLDSMRVEINGNEQGYDTRIAQNQADLEAAGHWGVPCLVFEDEPYHGQDRIDLAVWRMKQKGLKRRC